MCTSIQIQHLSKSYGKVQALLDFSLEVHAGELFGIIGPDGAGKTTLFRILATLLLADAGSASICGWDVVHHLTAIRSHIGYMPGHFSLYPDLTVEENLTFFANIFNTSLAESKHWIQGIYQQIEPFKDRPAGKLSGGMKQKLALCCALIHHPKVLLLDEPTTGVDPVSRKEFWDLLKLLKQQGITLLVSTPYMDEASRCDRIALIRNGKCLSVDTPEHIRGAFQYPLLAVKASSMYPLLKDLRTYPDTLSCFSFGDVHHLTLKSGCMTSSEADRQALINKLQNYLQAQGHQLIQIQFIEPSIEDCFMLL